MSNHAAEPQTTLTVGLVEETLRELTHAAQRLDNTLTARACEAFGEDSAHPAKWDFEDSDSIAFDYGMSAGIFRAVSILRNALSATPNEWESAKRLHDMVDTIEASLPEGWDED